MNINKEIEYLKQGMQEDTILERLQSEREELDKKVYLFQVIALANGIKDMINSDIFMQHNVGAIEIKHSFNEDASYDHFEYEFFDLDSKLIKHAPYSSTFEPTIQINKLLKGIYGNLINNMNEEMVEKTHYIELKLGAENKIYDLFLSKELKDTADIINSLVNKNNPEETNPEWKITKEDMGLVDMKDQALIISGPASYSNDLQKTVETIHQHNADSNTIFAQGGTDFSKVLAQALDDMQKNNPDTPKHVIILTDGDNGDLIESLTTTTYNEEQNKAALKDMPETEFKEVNSNEPVEKKIDWREALRRHFQTVEGGQKITFPEGTALDISFTGIPKPENEPITTLEPIVLYSMQPESMSMTSVEKNNTSREELLQRIKNVNSNVGSDTKNDNDNKPKLK